MPGTWYLPNKLPNNLTFIPSFHSPVTQFPLILPALGYKWVPLDRKDAYAAGAWSHPILKDTLTHLACSVTPKVLRGSLPSAIFTTLHLPRVSSFAPAPPPGPTETVQAHSTAQHRRSCPRCCCLHAPWLLLTAPLSTRLSQ